MPNIFLEKVTIKYKLKKKQFINATNEVSLTFPNDKISCIIGESGSGKTSILKAIIGLVEYDGDIKFDDVSIKNIPTNMRGISYVSQNIGLYPNLTVFNNIAFPLKIVGCNEDEIRSRIANVADLLHIRPILSRKPREISLGQAQRVAIARALVKKSTVYIFDEPFSNLDKPLSMQLTKEIKEIFKKSKNTAIFVSHDVNESLYLGDEIFVMNEGNIVESGTPTKIRNSKNKLVTELLVR